MLTCEHDWNEDGYCRLCLKTLKPIRWSRWIPREKEKSEK